MAPHSRARAMVAWVLLAVAVAVLALAAALPALPALGPSRVAPLFVLAAFHELVGIGLAVLAGILAVVALVLLRRRLAVAIGVVLLAAAVTVAVPPMMSRADASGSRPPATSTSLRILEWNTDQQAVSETTLAALLDQYRPDIVVLPEYFTQVAQGSLASLAAAHGMQIIGWDSSSATALISRSLGSYALADTASTPPWAGFAAASDQPGAPKLVIAHLQHPSLTSTALWRQQLAWAGRECGDPDALAIGDFNATLRNVGATTVGSCRDAATALGLSPVGTWPTAIPAPLGATIDHVFAGAGWSVTGYRVITTEDRAGSDHRPIEVELARR